MRRPLLLLSVVLGASVGLPACRDELVQTAYLPPQAATASGGQGGTPSSPAPLECQEDAPANELPAGAAFGEGDALEASPLAGGSYGPLEGPGIYVTARDTFRVYVNGLLVGQSPNARAPLFVPVSLLPGENVVAVSVHATAGAPAALVQVDELERSYTSDSDWKVSSSPEGDWRAPGYDDSAWASAGDLGAFGNLPGCDPADTFPTSSVARWIGAGLGARGPLALRKVIRVEPIGFAAGTTGGAEAAPQLVSTWEELESLAGSDEPATLLLAEGERDFRRTGEEIEDADACPSACTEVPGKSTYRLPTSGSTCAEPFVTVQRDDRVLHVGSNKTILGLGRGAALRGVSLDLDASQNVIVRNVALYDINPDLLEAGDAFTLTRPSGVWIDHVTVKWVSDAFMDVLTGTTGVTVSYSLFEGGTDGECGGRERWGASFNDSQATIHHTRFDQLSTRAPHADGPEARLHLFNNVYSNTTDWTVGSSCLAQVLLEGCVFENAEAATRVATCSDSSDRGLLDAVAGSNLYRDESAVYLGGDGTEPHDAVFTPEYDYQLEPAGDAWPHVISRAGAGGPWALPLSLD